MKHLLTILAGAAMLLASGYVYGEDRMSGYRYGGDKTITNDDLQNAAPDRDSSTFNQMPMTEGSEGSAAGGVSKEPDTMQKSDEEKWPLDKTPVEPGKEPDGRNPSDEPYTPGY